MTNCIPMQYQYWRNMVKWRKIPWKTRRQEGCNKYRLRYNLLLTRTSLSDTKAPCTPSREADKLFKIWVAVFMSPDVDPILVEFPTSSIACSMASVSLAPFSITSFTSESWEKNEHWVKIWEYRFLYSHILFYMPRFILIKWEAMESCVLGSSIYSHIQWVIYSHI